VAALLGRGRFGVDRPANYLVPGIRVLVIGRRLIVIRWRRIRHSQAADCHDIWQRGLPSGLAEAGGKHRHDGWPGRETGSRARLGGLVLWFERWSG
jgi:hypothetical protein